MRLRARASTNKKNHVYASVSRSNRRHARVTHLDRLFITFLLILEVFQRKTLRPIPLVQVHQHRLLELRLAIVHRNGVIVPIEAMNESLDGRLVDMSNIGGRLPRFLAL